MHAEVCRQVQAFWGHYGSPTATAGSHTFKTTAIQQEEKQNPTNESKLHMILKGFGLKGWKCSYEAYTEKLNL